MKRPIDSLDEYERELCESEDPAAHTALLMRLLMKKNGVDPDGDWTITGQSDIASGDSISVESCKVLLKPDAILVSLKTEEHKDGKLIIVESNEYLQWLIKKSDDWNKIVEVDGELSVIKSISQYDKHKVRLFVTPATKVV